MTRLAEKLEKLIRESSSDQIVVSKRDLEEAVTHLRLLDEFYSMLREWDSEFKTVYNKLCTRIPGRLLEVCRDSTTVENWHRDMCLSFLKSVEKLRALLRKLEEVLKKQEVQT